MTDIRDNSLRRHWTLDPDVRFLNHGSFGACPRVVLEAQAEYRARLEREPVDFLARHYEEHIDAVRSDLAAFLHAAPEDLAFVPNATTAVNAVLRSLDVAAGDEIVVTNQGYNACNNVVAFVAERNRAVRRVVDLPFPIDGAATVVESILASVNDRTRLVLIDHITSPTGLVLPVREIAERCAERGVRVLVDGAHAPGMLDLDVPSIGAAYYTGNLHKWVCAPKGAAFLWVRRELQPTVRPAIISHGANSERPGRSRFMQEFDWVGTDDPTAVLAVRDALRFMATLLPGGWGALRERCRALALAARSVLTDRLGVAPPAPDTMIAQLVSLPLPDATTLRPASAFTPDPLHLELFDKHRIEVPVFPWPTAPKRLLRISAQIYNELGDYEALADALTG